MGRISRIKCLNIAREKIGGSIVLFDLSKCLLKELEEGYDIEIDFCTKNKLYYAWLWDTEKNRTLEFSGDVTIDELTIWIREKELEINKLYKAKNHRGSKSSDVCS